MTFPRRVQLLMTLWACFVWIQVECNPTAANTNTETEKSLKDTQSGHKKVAALERSVRLGDLYDATTDDLWVMSILKSDLPNEAIQQTNRNHSSIQLIGNEPLKERMRKLDIEPSQFIRLLLEPTYPIDMRKYLKRFTPDPLTAKASLIYKFRTVVERFDPFSNASAAITDRGTLGFYFNKSDVARSCWVIDKSHVVVGREYGVDAVLTLKKKCSSPASAKEVQKQLEAEMQSIIEYLMDPSSKHPDWHKFRGFHLSADFISDTVPFSISDAVSIIKKIPKQLKNEKGTIKSFILEPLENIRENLKIQRCNQKVFKEMDQDLIDKLLNILQEIEDSTLLIDDLHEQMNDWKDMFPSDEPKKISDIKFNFDKYQNNLKLKLRNRIVSFRRGEAESETIKEVISHYENGNWTAASINNTISNDFRQIMNKMNFMNLFRENGASFVDNNTQEYTVISIDSPEKEIRVLSVDLNMRISSPYVQDIVQLLQSAKESGAIKYYIKDVPVPMPTVEIYSKGNKINAVLIVKKHKKNIGWSKKKYADKPEYNALNLGEAFSV